MSRGNTVAMDAALAGVVSRPAILAKMAFASGDVFMWSGVGDLVWNGDTYGGVGAMLSADFGEEAADGTTSGASFSISGVDSSWVAVALTENYQGRDFLLYYGELDAGGALIADPLLFFRGVMDQMSLEDSGESSVVTLSVERRRYDNRPPNALYDDKTQQRRFAGDKGFEFLPGLQERVLNWGVPGEPGQGGPRLPTVLPGGREP